MDLQKMMDAMSEMNRNTRSDYHLTLGKAIEGLSKFEEKESIRFDYEDKAPGNPHSYRGYYSDLSFEPCQIGERANVGSFLEDLKESLNVEFTGWKGGEFYMGENTPLWVATEGECGRAIIDILHRDDGLIITTKEILD